MPDPSDLITQIRTQGGIRRPFTLTRIVHLPFLYPSNDL